MCSMDGRKMAIYTFFSVHYFARADVTKGHRLGELMPETKFLTVLGLEVSHQVSLRPLLACRWLSFHRVCTWSFLCLCIWSNPLSHCTPNQTELGPYMDLSIPQSPLQTLYPNATTSRGLAPQQRIWGRNNSVQNTQRPH